MMPLVKFCPITAALPSGHCWNFKQKIQISRINWAFEDVHEVEIGENSKAIEILVMIMICSEWDTSARGFAMWCASGKILKTGSQHFRVAADLMQSFQLHLRATSAPCNILEPLPGFLWNPPTRPETFSATRVELNSDRTEGNTMRSASLYSKKMQQIRIMQYCNILQYWRIS